MANKTNKNIENHVEEGDYIVFLPKDIMIKGYDMVPKIAETHAGSERKAVANVLFRTYLSKDFRLTKNEAHKRAKITISELDKKFGGAQKYAVIIPEIEPKDDSLTDYVLAIELAAKNGLKDAANYVDKARFLLRGVGKLPATGVGWH